GEWVRLLGRSQFGTVWLLRHGVLLLLAALLLLREREQTGADRLALRLEAGLLATVAAAAMAWAGHAAAVEPGGLTAALLDALHLLAAGAWFGALAPLALVRREGAAEGAGAGGPPRCSPPCISSRPGPGSARWRRSPCCCARRPRSADWMPGRSRGSLCAPSRAWPSG